MDTDDTEYGGGAVPIRWIGRLEEAFEAAVARQGGPQSARPKAVLLELQPQFPGLQLQVQNIKWHLQAHRKREERVEEWLKDASGTIRWTGRLKEAFNAAVADLGGLAAARPRTVLQVLQADFPLLTLQNVKWHLQTLRKKEAPGGGGERTTAATHSSGSLDASEGTERGGQTVSQGPPRQAQQAAPTLTAGRAGSSQLPASTTVVDDAQASAGDDQRRLRKRAAAPPAPAWPLGQPPPVSWAAHVVTAAEERRQRVQYVMRSMRGVVDALSVRATELAQLIRALEGQQGGGVVPPHMQPLADQLCPNMGLATAADGSLQHLPCAVSAAAAANALSGSGGGLLRSRLGGVRRQRDAAILASFSTAALMAARQPSPQPSSSGSLLAGAPPRYAALPSQQVSQQAHAVQPQSQQQPQAALQHQQHVRQQQQTHISARAGQQFGGARAASAPAAADPKQVDAALQAIALEGLSPADQQLLATLFSASLPPLANAAAAMPPPAAPLVPAASASMLSQGSNRDDVAAAGSLGAALQLAADHPGLQLQVCGAICHAVASADARASMARWLLASGACTAGDVVVLLDSSVHIMEQALDATQAQGVRLMQWAALLAACRQLAAGF